MCSAQQEALPTMLGGSFCGGGAAVRQSCTPGTVQQQEGSQVAAPGPLPAVHPWPVRRQHRNVMRRTVCGCQRACGCQPRSPRA